ncbi:hypothetical protein A1O1_08987 [Capronia coronata CBS 617.96]|uniref:MHYT domain-containing protein n=1 Tax=Capronia coronata CBS 617.96 TaxID=1182541 RepID=W9XNP8_9EURO|nr:uncharacterized protein A1O1_08987 [Capronia coronata CBS 617.96]EXJ78586.1 hypothetical protein A1O1_08987 [Capronia coronata CBS 617.96]
METLLLRQYAATIQSTNTAVSYSAGHIVLSYVTSLLGCITTLELLQRRTSTRGAYNGFLLAMSAVTMGGISIWGMHFVANGAVILDHGAPDRQIVYKPTFTAISFLVPIVVLLMAFYMVGVWARAGQICIAVACLLTGAAVCGMHSLEQYGVENYTCSYKVKNLVGSAIISVMTSFIALSVFFRLRDTWTDCWWKRFICGAILAVAVSGMHWTAAVGTMYKWKGDSAVHSRLNSQTTIVAATLSMGACMVLLVIAFIRSRRMRRARIKAQRLVLACAYFDEDGKLMVTEEGILPSEKITNHYLEKTFGEDELSRSQATFLWVYRASRNWAVLKELIPVMTEYIKTDPAAKRYRPGHTASNSLDDASEVSLHFSPVFKQLFCMAAERLANRIHEPLEQLGTLFEEPLETGALFIFVQSRTALTDLSPQTGSQADVESGHSVARGKYLFVTRRLDVDETFKFAALGYRFAAVARIAEPMAKRMQINRDDLVARMRRMQISVCLENLPAPGVHLACFMLRPSICKSFDVLVPESRQNQLPHVSIQPDDLTLEQWTQIGRLFDESTVSNVLGMLLDRCHAVDLDEDIASRLYEAIMKLVSLIGSSDTVMQAKFSARAVHVPCQQAPGCPGTATCTFLTVRMIRDVRTSSPSTELVYVPLSSFSLQQQYQTVGWYDEQFAREVKAEFGHLLQDGARRRRFNSVRVGRLSTSPGPSSHPPGLSRARIRQSLAERCHPSRNRGSDRDRDRDTRTLVSLGSDQPKRLDGPGTLVANPEGESPPLNEDSAEGPPDRRGSVATTVRTGNWVAELLALFQLRTESWRSVRSATEESPDFNVLNTGVHGTSEPVTRNNTRTRV